jgi:putative transposase
VTAVQDLSGKAPAAHACAALGLARATYYRAVRPPRQRAPRPAPPRALQPAERREVRNLLVEPRFVDLAPREIHAVLLDEGRHPCSVSTMYRVLHQHEAVRERRDQLVRPAYAKPELVAVAPNQVWTWDITKLRGPAVFVYFHLYVAIDLFSRYVVAWLLAHAESATFAARMLREAARREDIEPGTLTWHADRGAAMRSKNVAQLCADLDIRRSFSRPHTSNDNAYSESGFKTLKYDPEFPDRFASFNAAHEFCAPYFDWYNRDHRHSGIAFLTPEAVHRGRAVKMLAARQATLDAAFTSSPTRFAGRRPLVRPLPPAVWINPPDTNPKEHVLHIPAAH